MNEGYNSSVPYQTSSPNYIELTLGNQVLLNVDNHYDFDYIHFTAGFIATAANEDLVFTLRNNLGNWYLDDMSITGTAPITPSVPEPSTWAMLLLGFAGIGFMAYRRKSKSVLMAV